MKILVMMDMDGHFNAAHPTDRKATLNLLKNICDGDCYSDIVGHYDDINYADMCCKDWKDFISEFTGRGTLEYVEIPDTVPVGCKCEKTS
jgi:hypothetical protein